MPDDLFRLRRGNDPVINQVTSASSRLHRPDVNHWRFIALFAATMLLAAVAQQLSLAIEGQPPEFSTPRFLLWMLLWLLAFSRPLAIHVIRCYQRYASDSTRCRCCHHPSCSEYTIICLYKYGILTTAAKAFKRLRNCGKNRGTDFP